MDQVYVMGGGFWKNGMREFLLIRPSGDGQLPYVAATEDSADKLYRSAMHHSHLYRVKLLARMAYLVRYGEPETELRTEFQTQRNIVTAPPEIALTGEQISEIEQKIATGEFSGNW